MLACIMITGGVTCLGLHPSAPQIVYGQADGALHVLELGGLNYGPIIVTAWHAPSRKLAAFGCLHCRTWSEIPQSDLGGEIPCPKCGRLERLNSFTIEGDWAPMAGAWQAGEQPVTPSSRTLPTCVSPIFSSLKAERDGLQRRARHSSAPMRDGPEL